MCVVEIERRFVVSDKDAELLVANKEKAYIEQCYLDNPDDKAEIRLRKKVTDKGTKYYITIKTFLSPVSSMEKIESEDEISKSTYELLMYSGLVKSPLLKKERYYLDSDKRQQLNKIFIDSDRHIWLFEHEFTSIKDAIEYEVPSWAYKEVTDNADYYSRNLARGVLRRSKKLYDQEVMVGV
jgi:CYTH domain-containing protein